MDKKYLLEDLARDIVEVFFLGKINTDQETALKRIQVILGDVDPRCKHDMDSTCDANNVFHCIGCGEVVPQPSGTFITKPTQREKFAV